MTLPDVIRINLPNVVSEVFDGEIVCVNLETGSYYCIKGSGVFIWSELLLCPMYTKVLISSFNDVYDMDQCEEMISTFIEQLLTYELVVEMQNEESGFEEVTTHTSQKPSNGLGDAFIEQFNDLQDILLLDPIHDVDETGWPVASNK